MCGLYQCFKSRNPILVKWCVFMDSESIVKNSSVLTAFR